MKISIFRKFNQVEENIDLPVILEQIRSGKYKAKIESLRELISQGRNEEFTETKRTLPAFTPSGVFEGGRKLEFLKEYSGYLILDLDHLDQDQLISAKATANKIPFTYASFISPSGSGLKILVKVFSRPIFHKQTWEEVKEYYEHQLELKIDPSGKDLTRLCFVSWDDDLYLNESAKIFKSHINMVEEDIEKVVRQIESLRLDITSDYNDWIHIAFSLIDGIGEESREYFHRISKFNPEYNPVKCNEQFDKCLNSTGSGITIGTFFHLAREKGIIFSAPSSMDEKDESIQPNSGSIPTDVQEKKKRKKNRISIIEEFLTNHYQFRFNIVTSQLEVLKIQPSAEQDFCFKEHKDEANPFEPLTDYFENSILRSILYNNIRCSITSLRSILFSDFCKKFDPFQDYFSRLIPWDGETDYIRQLTGTIKTTNDEQWHDCFKKWLVAAVASVLNPSIINHTAIIFSGPQGMGKTTWMERLCPEELKSYLFSGTINPNNKDTLSHLSECFFINMDELENMNRTEIGIFKEMITKSVIRIRRAYGHHNEKLYRRASFMGSVNSSQFLNDTTGSRRFLCFEIFEIDYLHTVDINAVLSQAFGLYRQGFRFYFDKNEIQSINSNNEEFQIRTVEEELLLTYFEPVPVSFDCKSLTAANILSRIAQKTNLNISIHLGASISLGKALKKHGFNRYKKDGVFVWAIKEK